MPDLISLMNKAIGRERKGYGSARCIVAREVFNELKKRYPTLKEDSFIITGKSYAST